MKLPTTFGVTSIILTVAVCSIAEPQHASTLTPPVLPLIVRNPYLSTWLASARDEPWHKWPMFWTGESFKTVEAGAFPISRFMEYYAFQDGINGKEYCRIDKESVDHLKQVGFGVLASVPHSQHVFPLLGRPQDSLGGFGHKDEYHVSTPVYKGAQYDASTTNLTYHIPSFDSHVKYDHVEIILSFLSPITPQSTLRQSLPAAYLTIYVEGSFEVNIYIDVNGQWVSGDRGSRLKWHFSNNVGPNGKHLKTWSIKKEQEASFTEINDRAEWGTLHLTAPDHVQHQCGTSALLRQRFAKNGSLENKVDDNYRGIMDDEPVFAFSHSFRPRSKPISGRHGTRDHITFAIAHTQTEILQYASPQGLAAMPPLWASWFSNETALLNFHYNDFEHANTLARQYTTQLAHDAYKSGSNNYMDIVALSARQVLGATTFSGTAQRPLLFIKEISSDGNCQTVDVIFPAWPFFLYTNPRWGGYLLQPLLEHQLSGQYPNNYSMHDLGSHFPNVTGHADGKDEYMPVEECGNMLIMGLSLMKALGIDHDEDSSSRYAATSSAAHDYASSTEDIKFPLMFLRTENGISYIDEPWGSSVSSLRTVPNWVRHSYKLFKQWTTYLVDFSLEPHNQLSTDDFAGRLALQTNLALKGIIGIKAMSELASLVGEQKDKQYYENISETYLKKWEEYGISQDKSHAKLAYNWYGSWTTLYSLFSDALLCFHPSITGTGTADDGATHHPGSNHAQEPLLRHDLHRRSSTISTHTNQDFIPHYIYTNQSAFYNSVLQKYGLPLDSRHLYAKSDWQFFAAAVASKPVRKEMLDRVAKWVNETATDRPLSDLWETEGDGGFPEGTNFMARPVVGGHFAFLALEKACV